MAAASLEVERAGGVSLAIPTDVSDYAQVEAAAQHAEAELGPVDVWVNVAFTSVFAPFTEIAPEEFRRVTDVTYHGYVYGTRAALDLMLPRDRGAIVQVGSALAYRGIPLQSAYCGSKHAIQGFNESLRTELLHNKSNVHGTMVQMPAVNTPQFSWVLSRMPKQAEPVAPIYQPEVAAKAVLYTADHPKRREYWVGGSTMGTLLGNAVAPGCSTATSPEPASRLSNLTSLATPTRPRIYGNRQMERTAATSALTASSMTSRPTGPFSCGPASITG